MNIDLIRIWNEMGWPVRAVVFVLTMQAIASLAVAIDRTFVLWRARVSSRAFANKVAPLLQRGEVLVLEREAAGDRRSPLASLMSAGLRVYVDRIQVGDDDLRAAELARRAIERHGASTSESLGRGLGVLASTGSTAPFVGLLGTVLGIIHAFQSIAATGSGGIGTIGAAIGEALVVTGYGLVVAIPTVLLFHWISGQIARLESGLANAGAELADRLECLDASALATPGAALAASSEPASSPPQSAAPERFATAQA